MPQMRLLLASASPRRRELLAAAGYTFDVLAPPEDAEGSPLAGESAGNLVQRLALAKASSVALQAAGRVIVACDTVVVCRGEILGKPIDHDDARWMLARLSGTQHEVYSGLCVLAPGLAADVRTAITRLRMAPLGNDELEAYLDGGQWQGKAGAFGYQDRLDWLTIIEGSESNVVGLPLELLEAMLADTQVDRVERM